MGRKSFAAGGSGMGRTGADRRKYARIDTGDMVSVAPLNERDRLAVSRDVSSGGIRFEAIGFELSLGEVLRVTFNLGETTVSATGRVAWVTELDPITLEVGLEFTEIDADTQLLIEQMAESGQTRL
jgi:hypothetical protein